MPNWCMNKLRITHDDLHALDKFVEGWNSGSLFQALIPCPQELLDTVSGSIGLSTDGNKSQQYRYEMHQFQMDLNKRIFGYKDWYDYCVSEWGTKWDVGYRSESDNLAEIQVGEGQHFVEVSFESAWSPPIEAYDKLSDLGYRIEAYYYEPGCAFCGRYDEDGEQTYQIESGVKWAKKNLPRDIDEAFGIIETMEQYAEAE